jgi:CHAT domain-containing protein/Tfp pilus assembly protein PilF
MLKLLLLKVLDIQDRVIGKNHPSYANTINSLAGVYTFLGNYFKAEVYYNIGLELFSKIYGVLNPQYAVFISNMGLFYKETGDFEKAQELIGKALEIVNGVFGPNHQDNVPVITSLANVFMEKHNYSKAEELLLRAAELTIMNLGEQHPDYITNINNIGNFYSSMGNYKEAIKSFEYCHKSYIAFYGEQNQHVINSINNMGTAFLSMALQEQKPSEVALFISKAKEYFLKALSMDSVLGKQNHPDHAAHLNNMAELYKSVGEPSMAKPLYIRSLEIEEEVFGINHPSVAIGYHNLALLLLINGDFAEASQMAEKSLEIKKKIYGEKSVALSETYGTLAYINQQSGNIYQAKEYYLKNIEMNSNSLQTAFSFLSEEEKASFLNTALYYAGLFNNFVNQNKDAYPELTGYMANNELLIKGVLLRSVKNMRNTVAKTGNNQLKEKLDNWLNMNNELAVFYRNPVAENTLAIDSLEKVSNILEKELVKASNVFNIENSIVENSWEEIKKKLNPGEVAIDISKFDYFPDISSKLTKYVALIIKPDSEYPVLVELFEEKELINVLGSSSGTTFNYVSGLYKDSKLYDIIWQPLEEQLANCKSVYFSPSGLLNRIAFSALRNEKGFLCSQVNLVQLNSIADLNSSGTFSKNDELNALVLGGVEYSGNDTISGEWKYLKGTLDEATTLSNILKENGVAVNCYIGKNASEKNLKTTVNESIPSIVHIATHGFFFPDPDLLAVEETYEESDLAFRGKSAGYNNFVANSNPLMRSGLVLSGANDVWLGEIINGEDGVLTAYEVSNMNLSNTSLVVLSACETGLGEIKGSEGVYGLSRAFRLAGAQSLIISLWQVPDHETSEFMKSFYTSLMKTKNIRDAFRLTQKAMSKKYDPYFWAAFVLID